MLFFVHFGNGATKPPYQPVLYSITIVVTLTLRANVNNHHHHLPPGKLSVAALVRSGSSAAGTSADSLLDVLALGDAMPVAAAGGGFGAAATPAASARPSPSSIGITLAVAKCSLDHLGAASQLLQPASST